MSIENWISSDTAPRLHLDGRLTGGGGAYRWMTPHIAAMASVNPLLAHRVLMIDRVELHFLALCVSLIADPHRVQEEVLRIGRLVDVAPRDEILSTLVATSPSQTLTIVKRLSGGIWRPVTYRRLIDLMEEPRASTTLRHMRSVSRRDVRNLAALPTELRDRRIVGALKGARHRATVLFAIDFVRRLRRDLTDDAFLNSLRSLDPNSVGKWVSKHYERVRFPCSPFSDVIPVATGELRFISFGRDLVRTGKALRNCAASRMMDAVRGDSVFYRYRHNQKGDASATQTVKDGLVELVAAPDVGWVAIDALGWDNETLPPDVRAAIVSALKSEGILIAPRVSDPDAPWSDLWFD